jgi:hypothetical protein
VATKIHGKIVQVSEDGDLITDISEAQLAGVSRTTDTKVVVDNEHEDNVQNVKF